MTADVTTGVTAVDERLTHRDKLYIGGEWRRPASARTLTVLSPATEELLGVVPEGSAADMDAAVRAARQAFVESGWATADGDVRAAAMERLAAALERRGEITSRLVTAEMGMTASISPILNVTMPATLLRYYAGLARDVPAEQERRSPTGRALVRREPAGVAALIVPWNSPQSTLACKLAPALATGCTVVVKPSPQTPLDAYLLAEAAAEAGIPDGVINIVAAGREAGESLVRHPGVDKVSFTGSTAAGRRIAGICGEQLKLVTLELGGKSAAVILEDADLDVFLTGLPRVSLMISGQVCTANTRILAPRSRYDEIVDGITELVRRLPVGDPADPGTFFGPLVSAEQRDRVEGYIRVGAEEGARITTGGRRPPGFDKGWYVEPVVFADVRNDMRVAQEEIFGPVLSVIPYRDEAEALSIANDSAYGLGGSIWTADESRGVEFARRVESGTVGINGYSVDIRAPFGGVKASGFGREYGPEGLEPYLRYKSVFLNRPAS